MHIWDFARIQLAPGLVLDIMATPFSRGIEDVSE